MMTYLPSTPPEPENRMRPEAQKRCNLCGAGRGSAPAQGQPWPGDLRSQWKGPCPFHGAGTTDVAASGKDRPQPQGCSPLWSRSQGPLFRAQAAASGAEPSGSGALGCPWASLEFVR